MIVEEKLAYWLIIAIVGGMFGISLSIIRSWVKDSVKQNKCELKHGLLKKDLDREVSDRKVKEEMLEEKMAEMKEAFVMKADEQQKQTEQMIQLLNVLVKEVKNGNGIHKSG